MILSVVPLRLTFRVAEPEGLARRLPFLANGVTGRGLGEGNEVTGAGNPVLYEGQLPRAYPEGTRDAPETPQKMLLYTCSYRQLVPGTEHWMR